MTVKIIALLLLVTLVSVGRPAPAGAQAVGEVFRKVSPSVVVIRSKGRDVSVSGQVRFGEIGSGVLISADGKVMTAAHVVHAMDEISVEFIGGETVPARVVSSEPAADLSLLQLDRVPAGVKVSRLADSRSVRVGDQVLVVGAPYGLAYSLSVGYVSARWPPNSVYPAFPLAEFFQTDATINTGNSGGPLFNLAGDVIGIVSHNISKGGGSEGLGFVVTINTAKDLLLARRSIWTGLEGHTLSGDLAAIFNLPQPEGFLVKTVAKGSPAEEVGIRGGTRTATIDGQTLVVGGDVLLAVDGIPAGNLADYTRMREHLQRLAPGATITVTVLRAGRVLNLVGKAP
ncbi:MAG TPA: trypsin-like peptidase domain-containing protein [Candidatus Limnocylindria bacterium]|nr:trypsin-like peptidase domain-containing protein [Candidatus Limnocylindria bacterium]